MIVSPMKSAELRQAFLDYFASQGHTKVPSSSLVPHNDPTLLFTNAGMNQFKDVFLGRESRDYTRATSSQRCVRAGGKHNDLENVGYTARHHTFFEMLGNFSFGDYFKREAIKFAWEFLTGTLGLPEDRLWVTVHVSDDEAADIWLKEMGVSAERFSRLDEDNFWQMGDTGPCGPSSEIFYDHGAHVPGGPPGSEGEDLDRYIEIWNLVFMQYDRQPDGELQPLPKPSVDTGMGLERIAAVLQGVHSNYEIDLFQALLKAAATATGCNDLEEKSLRVIADHIRSASFLICDGVIPSNEGRGYVLRRIIRRALRHGHKLGQDQPFFSTLVSALVEQMGEAYPELRQGQSMIEETLKLEETRFINTLDRGLKLLDEELSGLEEGANLPGEAAFKLYDTYGFPLDLTQDALREQGRAVDTAGFDAAMAEQKAKARAAWSGSGETADATVWYDIAEEHGVTEFLGYDTESAEGQVLALVKGGGSVGSATAGDEVMVVVNQTPFYGESGGQVGDMGLIRVEGGTVNVTDTKKVAGVFIHIGKVTTGEIKTGQAAELIVDHARRTAIRANHSATHLLHEALRETLGAHVAQRGSLNAPDRLRFDFSHTKGLSAEELRKVEEDVNGYIRQNTPVETRIMTPDDARALGAQALFGEKYGDEVRVVSMGRADTGKGADGMTYSLELCGGTHVKRTGDIGLCVILGDSASSAGVRRIEALTGQAALDHLAEAANRAEVIAAALKTPVGEVVERVKTLAEERKKLEQEVANLKRELAMGGGGKGAVEAKMINGIPFLAQALEGVSGKDLRALIDAHKTNLGSGVILLITEEDGKVAVACGVTDDLTATVSAVDVLKAAVPAVGGQGGGGRPDMAQGGGKDFSGADAAIAAAETLLKG
jgi:alanyl-tRNA synthetase